MRDWHARPDFTRRAASATLVGIVLGAFRGKGTGAGVIAVVGSEPMARRVMAAACSVLLAGLLTLQLRPEPVSAVAERSPEAAEATVPASPAPTAAPAATPTPAPAPTPARAPKPARAPGPAPAPTPETQHEYLQAVFQSILGRSPSAADVATWAPAVQLGDLSSVTRALSRSNEWAGAQIGGIYRDALRREVDAAGRAHWVDRIGAGATLDQVAAALYGSGEYYARAGSTPERFVDALYRDLLGRPADPGGLATLVQKLGADGSRGAVAARLYRSAEARASRVSRHYESVLGRPADPSGQRFWTGQVERSGDAALAAALASSGEFFRRATGQEPPQRPARGRASGFQPFARAGRVHLTHPAAVVDFVGFHQASQPAAQPLVPTALTVDPTVLWSRGRGTDRRSAADIVVPPGMEIRAPVTGTVVEAGTYRLYCRYDDERLFIAPDADPSVRVAMLHVTGVLVEAGERVQAGVTPVAHSATVLPFPSQVDALNPDAPWPHVHMEVAPAATPRATGTC